MSSPDSFEHSQLRRPSQPPSYPPRRRIPQHQSASGVSTPRPAVHSPAATPPAAQRASFPRSAHWQPSSTAYQQQAAPVSPSRVSPENSAAPDKRRAPQRTRLKLSYAVLAIILLVIALPLTWIGHLYSYGNSKLSHISALSTTVKTPGTTYLIVGSDERLPSESSDVTGIRADTIMLLHKPQSGRTALVSIPRDTLVDVDGWGLMKINATVGDGDPHMLVNTVESITQLHIDHYVQIGMHGVEDLANAVGGVRLCLDYDVSDPYSGLEWKAGCHEANGKTALAFSRMRYSDPLGDIGRTARQRQVVSAIINKALSKDLIFSPGKQKALVGATASVLTVGEGDSLMDVAQAGLALREALGDKGVIGAPPIASLNYEVYGLGSTVLLDPDSIDAFWQKLAQGTLTEADFFQS